MYRYILFAYFTMFLSGIYDNARGPIYPQVLEHFQIDHGMAAMIFSLASFSGLLMLLFSLKVIKKIGIIKTNFAFIALITIAAFGAGAVISLDQSYYLFLICIFLYGIGAGGSTVTLNLLVSLVTSSENRRRVLSGLHSMYGIASLCIPLVVSALLLAGISWSMNFYIIGFVGIILLLSSFQLQDFKHQEESSHNEPTNWRAITLWGSALSLYVASEIVVSSRLVVYLMDVAKFDQIKANNYLSIFFIMLLAGRLLFAFIRLPFKTFTLLIISGVLSLACLTLGLLSHPIFLAMVGFTMSLFFPYFMDYIVKSFGAKANALIASCMIFVNLGLMAVHIIFGVASDYFGMYKAMWMSPFMLLISLLILALVLPKTVKVSDE